MIRKQILFLLFLSLLSSMPVCAASFSRKAPVVTSECKETTLTLTWNKRKNLTGYQVYLTNSSGAKRRLLQQGKALSYTQKGLFPGKTYYYRVRGYRRKNGKTKYTSYSEIIKIKIPVPKAKSTLKKFLKTALEPVGSTMYVWGGGWNKADTGAGKAARTLGVSPKWKLFFEQQTPWYDYHTTKYQIANGLDCSGYVGWCIYNIMNTKNGKQGYVMYAEDMAKNYASRGWGKYIEMSDVKDYRAGDIMSSTCTDCGHVWIVIGQCEDGSVVLVHASPPGVQLAGTPSKNGTVRSEAVILAEQYMKDYYPEWYRKYPNCTKGSSYLSHYSQMRWHLGKRRIMTDPDDYRNKNASEILQDLFAE